MSVRPATTVEYDAVTGILDAAALQTDPERTRVAIAANRALVAVEDGRVLGALVAVPEPVGVRIDAVAVRRRRRGQGLGTELVEAAGERHGRLVAEFDDAVRPFYEKVGFDCEPADGDGRCRGVRE